MKNILTFPFRFIAFWAWYIWTFVVANLDVMKDVVTPGNDAHPGIGRYKCHSLKDWQYVMLSILITVTPGTLVVGAGRDTKSGAHIMYVHGLYAESEPDLLKEISELEDRMLKGLVLHPKDSVGKEYVEQQAG